MRIPTVITAAGSIVLLTALAATLASCGDSGSAQPAADATATHGPTKPARDPNGPWVIPNKASLTTAETRYTLVCIDWHYDKQLGFSDWASNSGLAAATKNTGLMDSVDAVSRDAASFGAPGAVATSKMNEFCKRVHLGK